jgi:GNAT superfamily N-acetyltransferase
MAVRPVRPDDYTSWRQLWLAYNAFYGREGVNALPEEITTLTFSRFFESGEPVHALVAEDDDQLVGLAHFLFHRSTSERACVCYLEDLFTAPSARRRGVAQALIEAVCDRARAKGSTSAYLLTQNSNTVARRLYDRLGVNSGFIAYRLPFGATTTATSNP